MTQKTTQEINAILSLMTALQTQAEDLAQRLFDLHADQREGSKMEEKLAEAQYSASQVMDWMETAIADLRVAQKVPPFLRLASVA